MKSLFNRFLLLLSLWTLNSNAQSTLNWIAHPFDTRIFIQNLGQYHGAISDSILYGAPVNSGMLYFTKKGMTFKALRLGKKLPHDTVSSDTLTISFQLNATWINASPNDTVTADTIQTYTYNYGISTSLTIKANVYKSITYHSLYPGIDAIFSFPNDTGGIIYKLIVHPGAKLSQVKLLYDTTTGMSIDGSGNMVIMGSTGKFVDHAPISSYLSSSDTVRVHYKLSSDTESFFSYYLDTTKVLIVDPWTQIWFNIDPYAPSGDKGNCYDLDYDDAGDVYVYGTIASGSTILLALSKILPNGTVTWVYQTTAAFSTIYGDFAVQKSSGDSYLISGFGPNPPAITILELNKLGVLVHNFQNSSTNGQWGYRAEYDSCNRQIIIGGGDWDCPNGVYQAYTLGNLNGYPFTFTPYNVLNALSTDGDNTICLLNVDPDGGSCYMATTQPAWTAGQCLGYVPNFNNYLFGRTLPNLSTGFTTPLTADWYGFIDGFIPYMPGPILGNGFNGMASSPQWLYLYDGDILTQWPKGGVSQNASTNVVVPVGGHEGWGGLDVDLCDNVYVGVASDYWYADSYPIIYEYNASGAGFGAPSTVYTFTTIPGEWIYDLHLDPAHSAMYACGGNWGNQTLSYSGFVSSISYSPPVLTGTVTVISGTSCLNQCSGSASVSVSLCSPATSIPYTYSWSDGETTSTATMLCPDTNTVTVSAFCPPITYTATVNITPLATPTVTINGGNPLCCGKSEFLITTVSGGTMPYTYSWSNGSTTSAIFITNSACAGTQLFSVLVIDNNGCSDIATVSIKEDAAIVVSTTVHNESCFGGSNGKAIATVSGGTSPYTYSWSPSGGTNATATGLSAGNYTVTITDNFGCTESAIITITQPPLLTVTASVTTNETCNGGSNGSATSIVAGGTPAYTYAWIPSGGSNATASNLSAGTYTIIVIDHNGCGATASVTITQPIPITVTTNVITDVSCYGGSNGSASVTATNGTSPYTYLWLPAGGTNSTATALSAGNYTITVTDINGCTGTGYVTITQPAILTATVSITQTCQGSASGTATVNASGGTAPYTYLWSPGGQTTTTISGLSVGTYTVSVTDINGCTATASGTITVDNLSVTIAGYPNDLYASLACQNSPAWYCPVVTGGVGPYTYDWSNTIGGSTSTQITPCIFVTWASTALGGDVILKVTDANGCSAMDTFLVRGCCPQLSCPGYTFDNFDITYPNIPLQSWSPDLCQGTGCTVISYSVSAGWQISGFTPNSPIIINGILIIDADTYFKYCDVLMGTNARIVVHSGNTLTIDACHFHSCANMWQNITIEAGATLNIIDGSLMEDAEEVVLAANKLLTYPYTPGNSIYYLDQSIFNKNYIGVAVWADVLNTMSSPYPGTITGCTFSCDQANGITLPCNTPPGWSVNTTPVSLIAPYTTYRGGYGVAIDQVNYINVGTGSTGSTNIFQDIDEGIFSQKSITSVIDDDFYNMMTVVGLPFNNVPPIPLAGVYALGDNTNVYDLNVGGSGTNACIFNQCNYGVWVFNGNNASIDNNTISGFPVTAGVPLSRGIYLDNNVSGGSLHWTLNVDNNSITNEWIGVDNFSNINGKIYIKDNPVISSNANWAASFGVRINEPFWNNAYYDVDPYNHIALIANGVVAKNVLRAYIGYNTVDMTALGPLFNEGIIIYNSGFCLIDSNTINCTPSPIITSDGIGVTSSLLHFDRITCNIIGPLGFGTWNSIHIGGDQVPIEIRNNTMNIPNLNPTNTWGLYLKNANGFIGNQGNINLPVDNYYSNWANTLLQPPWSTNSGLLANRFYVNIPAGWGPVNPNNILNTGGNPIVFTQIIGTPNNNCHPPSVPPTVLVPTKDEVFNLLGDSLHCSEYVETTRWSDKYSIYHYLNDVDTTNLVDSSLAILHFVDSIRHGNIGSLDSICKLLGDPAGLTPTDLTIAQSLNSSLTAPDTAETELQEYYNILISIYSAGHSIPQGTQISSLQAIAVLCPDQYGPAVYFAQALLSPVDTTNYTDNCETDREHKPVKKKSSSPSNPDNLSSVLNALVYPNPANTVLNIALLSSLGQEAELQGKLVYVYLYDQMGALVLKSELNSSITTLSVSSLSQGIYHYRIIDNQQIQIKTGNVIIIR